ncbi:L-ascorbate oxidase [Physcomitrium patens]|uniref:L-ascorbate oxidase n=1 Tax=Physcomitrium patens TaxID=3218 RepID=A9SAC3_PHYPA|nr:L-ascorbate oxidase-like [Physcomitrium patens]PNR55755.1 hypothetical protein PHYPA_006652 [Physcomitrium patens]|eukprot:XP_024373525.1 L-ascorbate oxidase-like [Physcomitrella patens]
MKLLKTGTHAAVGCVLLVLLILQTEATMVRHNWTVDYMFSAPDCVEKLIIAANGQYPSPPIFAVEGDTIVIEVTNHIPTEGIVFHWHGIYQKGTPYYDGAAYVSQCPINPGETFTYKFKVDRAGTYFYHGHFGMQRSAGLYGSLIVTLPDHKKEPFSYDGEHRLLLNDWWHKSIYEQELGLNSVPFRFVGEPQSLLIEGRGKYNCSLLPESTASPPGCLTCNASSPWCAPHVIPVTPGETYRLRIASVASLSTLNFILENHKMTVVMADGHYVKPFDVYNLDIYSGQTYDVLFTANQDTSKNYWAAINVRGRNPLTPTGLAVIQYLPNPATLLPTTSAPVSPVWNDTATSLNFAKKLLAKPGYEPPPPKKCDRTLVLLGTQNEINGNVKWAVNNISYVHNATPTIAALKYKIKGVNNPVPPPDFPAESYNIFAPPSPPSATYGTPVYVFEKDDIVDVIVQNANTMTPNVSEIHPWHLHGHDFWVLGYGDGLYNASRDPASFNLVDPPLRNTVAVFPYGWVAFRYVADNPGAWPFHCHVESHFHMGMGTVFAEGVRHIPKLPLQTLGCGLTKKHL